jgi:inner membrane transporter RhtA
MLMPVLLLIAAMLSIQTGAAYAKQLLPALGASGTASLRLCFAAAVLCMVCRPWKTSISRRALSMIVVYGLAMGAMNLLIYLALARIPLGIAVALEFLGPLGVAVFASKRKLDILWVLLALFGVALLLPHIDSQASLPLDGIVYALAAGGCWALYIIYGQKAGALAPSGLITTIGMLTAACAIAPVGIFQQGAMLLETSLWPLAFAIAILSSAVPYYLEMQALKALPAHSFGVMMSMEPAIAALSGMAILGEQLSITQWCALFMVMLASAGCMRYADPYKAAAELTA